NSLLSGVINLFEKRGIEVVGAHQIMPELLSGAGTIVGRAPPRKAMANIKKAAEASKELGRLDIGQAAVAVGGRVVAVEGIEGTDGMLERVASMRNTGRLYENGRFGVLVKTMKPGQEMRVDLPAIGPDTINRLAEAGLRGVAVESDRSLILERQKTLKLAKFHEIFIYGMDLDLISHE
ncbi:MAG: LpxI family protein, partial [Rhizobiaceae bacterium]